MFLQMLGLILGALLGHLMAADALSDSSLGRELDSLIESDMSLGGQFSACVLRMRDGSTVWEHRPQSRQMPASVEKIFTTEAALRVLGPNYRFSTGLFGRGILHDTEWVGDLVLSGGGDPTLGCRWGATLTTLADTLQKLGIRHVTGSLIALDTLAGASPWDIWPSEWTFANAQEGYGAPMAGLNWDLNRRGRQAAEEPRRLVLNVFREMLDKRGITVAGHDSLWVRGNIPGSAPAEDWTSFGEVHSPRLAFTLRPFLAESINQIGEGLVLRMGAGYHHAKESPREAGLRRVRANLQTSGVRTERIEIFDGSGLSRYDAVPTVEIAGLLRRSWLSPGGERMVDMLPAGGQGTLRGRFRRLPSPSWVLAKTGTLHRVCNLAGILKVPDRDTLAFAIFCQNYPGSAVSMRTLQDKIISLLAGIPIRPQSRAKPQDSVKVKRPQPDSASAQDSADPRKLLKNTDLGRRELISRRYGSNYTEKPSGAVWQTSRKKKSSKQSHSAQASRKMRPRPSSKAS